MDGDFGSRGGAIGRFSRCGRRARLGPLTGLFLTARSGEAHRSGMNEYLIAHARVSTNEQDLAAQGNAVESLGVRSTLIYMDHGLTGHNPAYEKRGLPAGTATH